MKIKRNKNTKKSRVILRVILKTKQEFFKHQVKKIHFLKYKYFSNFKEKSGQL